MKKLFALVLALVMALSLVACGDKKDDSGDVTAEHTDTTTVAVGAVILARDDVRQRRVPDDQPRQVRRAESGVRRVHHLRALSPRRCQVLLREGL